MVSGIYQHGSEIISDISISYVPGYTPRQYFNICQKVVPSVCLSVVLEWRLTDRQARQESEPNQILTAD